uniref:G_PROTEIN_RECEP_F1_2 domain-containing protein n=1 Tax=Globodera rostochiensis TaxID=31243 RepID=A0A914HW01_GLORO
MAAINASSNDAIYLAYRFAGPSADLIVPAVALYVVVVVGIVSNAAVLVVTAKSSSLRGSANFLMAMLCMFELIHQTGHTFFLVVVISGTNFVSLLTADLFMAPMIFALNCGLMAMFCAAFDRLFAVAAAHVHKEIYLRFKYTYLLCHLFVCTIYGAFTVNYVLVYAFENAGNPTTGVMAETLLGPVGFKYFAGTAVLSLGSTCCYVTIFGIICCKNGVRQETNMRLMRSLVIILSINIGGYLFTSAIYQFIGVFGHLFGPPIRVWQLGFIAGILLNIGAGSNAIILYFNSSEYRRVFKNEFSALAKFLGFKMAVQQNSANQIRTVNLKINSTNQANRSILINNLVS